MSSIMRKPVFGAFDTNWAVQPQKIARDIKFLTEEVEGLYYLYPRHTKYIGGI